MATASSVTVPGVPASSVTVPGVPASSVTVSRVTVPGVTWSEITRSEVTRSEITGCAVAMAPRSSHAGRVDGRLRVYRRIPHGSAQKRFEAHANLQ
jgi:hypothetical protein